MSGGTNDKTRITYEGMCEALAAMQEGRDAVRDEYERLIQGCAAMEDAIGTMQWWRTAGGNGREQEPAAAAHTSLDSSISFEGCETTMDRCIRIAEARDGIVDCHVAADLLIDQGFNKGKRSNLVSALQQQMGSKEDLWEHVGPRTYRYRLYQGTGDTVSGALDETVPGTADGVGHIAVVNNFE